VTRGSPSCPIGGEAKPECGQGTDPAGTAGGCGSNWDSCGIAGKKLNSIRQPEKTVLLTEFAALVPFSWHTPGSVSHFNNALDGVGFVDGHVSFMKMYWNATPTNGIEAWHYNPPATYDYQWSGD
jgi:hypothetical protein